MDSHIPCDDSDGLYKSVWCMSNSTHSLQRERESRVIYSIIVLFTNINRRDRCVLPYGASTPRSSTGFGILMSPDGLLVVKIK